MAFPNENELRKVRKKLSKVDGTLGLGENPTPLERFRWDICQKFVKFKLKKNINQKQFSDLLEVDEAKVSKILRHRIEEFSTDRLIELYSKLDPDLKLKVS